MPSLATRRRRTEGKEGRDAAEGMMLEGGGNRGTATVDSVVQTEEKLAKYAAAERRLNAQSQKAHLFAFPLFLMCLLAIFSHSLHLSLVSCVALPLGLGLGMYCVSHLLDRLLGGDVAAKLAAEHGTPLVCLLLLFTVGGVALSQMFFRDKFGKPLM